LRHENGLRRMSLILAAEISIVRNNIYGPLLDRGVLPWFYCARDVEKRRPGASLRDKDGMWIGYMNFHDKEALDAFLKFSIASFTGSLLELVALSRGYALHQVCRDPDELDLGERPKALIGTNTITYGSNGIIGMPTDTGLVGCSRASGSHRA
jgi:hypothetical protein